MKAGLTKKEPEILKKWENLRIYERILARRKGGKTYILHDGPPYANGNIHIGTAYNKVMKDFIVKFKSMMGYYVPYVPGWDTHGLPIETEVMKAYKISRDTLSPIEFRKKCKEFTTKYIWTMTEQFKRLGVWGSWDDPYITYNPHYEAKQIEIFGEMAKKGYIYKGLKPVYWCTSCITALADAEVEYHDHVSPSIYVTFKTKEGTSKFREMDGALVVVWTTTPWTLPGNTAVALHPDFEYSLFEHKGNSYLVATELISDFSRNTGIVPEKIIRTFRGDELEGTVLRHPFIDRDSPIVFADYVTLDTGTGAVHTAPGHGLEDYETGLKYNLPIVSPLDDYGRFTDEVPELKGIFTDDANSLIMEHLRKLGVLLGSGEITHSYPHCWRCKNPVIFRATEQWFTSIDGFKEEALEAIENVEWIPPSSMNRIKSMVENRSDWCISRQRTWGVPLPIFYCKACHREVINDTTLKAVEALFAKEGSDSWFIREAEEILPEGFTCPHCGNSSFIKEKDIMDVWFDSGSSHAAVLETRKELSWPADLYIEGSDQHRGWFQSSLLTAVAARGRAPYRAVLTHGFTVDGEGKKMSKSLGNTIAPEEIIEKYGADIIRLWAVSSDYSVDIRISEEILDQLVDAYRKLRNTIRFMLGNLYGFNPRKDSVPYAELEPLDRWLLHRLQKVTGSVLEYYRKWEFHLIIKELLNFCNIDLSSFYLDIVKDRLYCSGPSRERRKAQTVLFKTLDNLLRLLAPILSFTTDEAYWVLTEEVLKPSGMEAEESIHLCLFPEVASEYIDERLAEVWETLIEVRKNVLKPIEDLRVAKKIGHSLESEVTIFARGKTYEILMNNIEELAPLFVVSKVDVQELDSSHEDAEGKELKIEVRRSDALKCMRCWRYLESVGRNKNYPDLCDRCASVIVEYYHR
jgi:isoleucyl-tRNA synthetase